MNLLTTERPLVFALLVVSIPTANWSIAGESDLPRDPPSVSTDLASQPVPALSVSDGISPMRKKSIGVDHRHIVAPLLELAEIHLSNHENQAARETYLKCISILESKTGFFDEAFIEPLSRLGKIHQDQGEHEIAIEYLQRAKHVTHRNKGLYNLIQIELIDALSESYLSLGRIKDAEREQWYVLRVYEHHYGNNVAGLVPAIFKLSNWYHRTGDFDSEYYIFRQAFSLLREHKREHDIDLVKPLRAIANNYALLGATVPLGERALEQAFEIVERNPDAMPFQYAEVLIDLGDWYLVKGNVDKALDFYKKSWSFMFSHEQIRDQVEEIFGQPWVLSSGQFRIRGSTEIRPQPGYRMQSYYGWPLPQHLNRGDAALSDNANLIKNHQTNAVGYVDLLLTVSADGEVSDVKVVEHNLAPSYKDTFLGNLDKLRFRPRFVNGEPVVTKQFRSRLTLVDTQHL